MSIKRMGLILGVAVIVAGLIVPALASADESSLWSGKVGLLIPVSGGFNTGIALGLERQISSSASSRAAIELDYAHPNDVNDWYLLYNNRYHLSGGGYLGWGAGFCAMDGGGNSSTNLAYRLFYGQNWNRTFGEIGWISGFEDGNSGVLLSVGTKF
jgi:hypothetical protein